MSACRFPTRSSLPTPASRSRPRSRPAISPAMKSAAILPEQSDASSASDAVAARSQTLNDRAPPELADLLTAAAVRERAGMVHDWVAAGRSPHFALDHD